MKTAKKNQKLSQVRIIGGDYRRRLVSFIDADGLRPTPDRLRETLFNWLNPHLVNATVLDCCAGSGVLGFEALSRGATHVTMIEANYQQYQQLKNSAKLLHIPDNKLNLQFGMAQQILPTLTDSFDIVFLDPPYHLNLWQQLLQLLIEHQCIHADSKIYLEADKPHTQEIADVLQQFAMIKSGKFGQIYASLYQPNDK